MSTLRERFQDKYWNEPDDKIVIEIDDSLTLEDIIYISTLDPDEVHLGESFSKSFDHYLVAGDWRLIIFKKWFSENHLLLYIMLAEVCHTGIIIEYHANGVTKGASFEFSSDYLEECWSLACEHQVDHKKFGDVIKQLGYKVDQDSSGFINSYLGRNVPTKSARSG